MPRPPMSYSLKSLMLLSTSAVGYTTHVFLFSPNCLTFYNYFAIPLSTVASLIVGLLPEIQLDIAGYTNSISSAMADYLLEITTETQQAQIIKGVELGAVIHEALLHLMCGLGVLIALASFLDLTGLSSRFSRIKGALVSSVLPNLNFLRGAEAIVLLLFLFLSLYFLEVHFFFIFTLGLSSDSLVYQFNFLLSSFFFIFLFKF